MNERAFHLFLADTILVLHTLFVVFVVAGFGLIVIGWVRRWGWVRNAWFRAAHLAAIGIVATQAWLGKFCPLTVWESRLRIAAGQAGYSETFIQHWLHRALFVAAPLWMFAVAYTVFGLLVVALLLLCPPGVGRGSKREDGAA